ncbi:hypothetical protein G7046_g5720 [Stylonectria norvegica]|nr:hypothetical protein G7046_g5720 [Stylonectria norvegica]
MISLTVVLATLLALCQARPTDNLISRPDDVGNLAKFLTYTGDPPGHVLPCGANAKEEDIKWKAESEEHLHQDYWYGLQDIPQSEQKKCMLSKKMPLKDMAEGKEGDDHEQRALKAKIAELSNFEERRKKEKEEEGEKKMEKMQREKDKKDKENEKKDQEIQDKLKKDKEKKDQEKQDEEKKDKEKN